MKSSTSLVVALAAGLMAVTPALAQSNNDTSKHNSAMSGATKKPTQGAPVGSTPQQYGTTAKKQPTAGTPAGFEPTHYGSAQAKKSE
jgi:hypothetical protein